MAKIVVITSIQQEELGTILDRLVADECPLQKTEKLVGIKIGGPIPVPDEFKEFILNITQAARAEQASKNKKKE